MQRARWGLYSRKVVNGGRWYCSISTYDCFCFHEQLPRCVWEAEGGADVCAGDHASLQSPLSLCHHAPPRAAAIHGDPCQELEDGRTDDVRGGAALALDCTRRRRCCTVICNKYIAVTYVKFREISQYCRENKSRESIAGKRYTIDALVAAQPLSRGGGRRQLVRHGGWR